jgi:energy-converting hydrogenase Eha subunit E
MAKTSGFKTWTKIGGAALIIVGGVDLAFGNTNAPLLPAPLANILNQNLDVLLVGVGLVLIFVI